MSYRFKIFLEKNELGGYTVTCPILPGCISQGDTRAEALENIKEAITCYIESMQKHGEPIPALDSLEETEVEVTV